MSAARAGLGKHAAAAGGALLVAFAIVTLSISGPAVALDADRKGFAIFRLAGSNGYSIIGIAASERADGRGDVALLVGGKRSSVTYAAPALITPTRLEADLGPLGRISLVISPTGAKRTVRSRCGGEPTTYETHVYRGSFEFNGEAGYTEASAVTLHEWGGLHAGLCPGVSRGEIGGEGLPGARLRLRRGSGHDRFDLQVNKNRPSARTRLEVELREKRGRIEIARSTTLWADAGAFRYDPLLRTATLAPPAPFSGQATFHRNAIAASRWTGSLTVDLPGRSDVPLAPARTKATLVPACWHEGEGRFRC
jgi:hypothetical protein